MNAELCVLILYLAIFGLVNGVLFVAGLVVLEFRRNLAPRKDVRWLFSRARRLGVFLLLLLALAAFFNSIWCALFYGRLYFHGDYCGFEFNPYLPITRAWVETPDCGVTGAYLGGTTIVRLQCLWALFAACTWGATILFYKMIFHPGRHPAQPLIPQTSP